MLSKCEICYDDNKKTALPKAALRILNDKGRNAVLIGEGDWRAIEETLFLMTIPNMAESIIKGGSTPLEQCLSEDEGEWQVFGIVYEKQAGKEYQGTIKIIRMWTHCDGAR